jgi:ABC-type multidrug transport system fused ATPase/permease subunit
MYKIIRRYLCESYTFRLLLSALLWGRLELFYPFFLQLRFFLYHRYAFILSSASKPSRREHAVQMMINKRLIHIVEESKKYIALNVLWQWFSLLANIAAIFIIAWLLQGILNKSIVLLDIGLAVCVVLCAVVIRYFCNLFASRMSYRASSQVKKLLRQRLYQKLLKLGPAYAGQVSTAEVVQVATEGIDQLEVYFGKYLPQFFYSFLAPLTLFVVFSSICLKAAVILLICVPLIPLSIVAVQKYAKKCWPIIGAAIHPLAKVF